MSDNQGASSAPSLQEALAEIEELKEQLSGSDLKVFTQNRELRVDNQKLREEVTRLAEECVTQTFAVRGLEKSKKALEKQVSEQQSRLTSLEATVSGLEAQVAALNEDLGIHRSQEIHLSQELERTISSNAEEVSQLKTEYTQTVEKTRQELEQAKLELEQELTRKLQAKAEEIASLQDRVEQFKEEFLSQEFTAVAATSVTVSEGGKAFSLLKSKLEGLLGFPGKTLVEQVFRHCGADEHTNDPVVLEEAFEALQDTASKLVRTSEQEVELSALLGSVWQELGLGSGEKEPVSSPVSDPNDETPAPPEDATAPQESAPTEHPEEESAEDLSLLDAPVAKELVPAPESAEEADSNDDEELSVEAAASVELETEESVAESEAVTEEDLPPAVVADEPSQERDFDSMDESLEPLEDSAETVLTPKAEEESPDEVQAEDEQESAADVEAFDEVVEEVRDEAQYGVPGDVEDAGDTEDEDPESAVTDTLLQEELGVATEAPEDAAVEEEPSDPTNDSEVSGDNDSEASGDDDSEASGDDDSEADFEAAAAALQNGDFAGAWPVFHQLRAEEPNEPTYLVGEIAALAGLERYQEAYVLGQGVDIAGLDESAEIYKESYEAVLIGLAEQSESLLQRKLYLTELIHFAGPAERLQAYLDEADEIPLRTADDAYLSLLQAKARIGHDDVTEYLLEALTGDSDRPEVFELLKQNLQRYPELTPLSNFLEQLLESSRADSLEAESEVKDLLTTDEPIEELLDDTDPGEEALVQVFLEHLLPRTGVKIELPSEEFEDLLADSEDAAFVGALRQALRSVDYTIFFESIEVLSYDGEERFILRSSPEPKPTLLFGSEIDEVPPEELRFLVLRELFSIYRRHSQLAHLAAGLDDALRVTFVKTCLEILKEAGLVVPASLLAEVETLQGLAAVGCQDAEFRVKLEALLQAVYLATESDSILDVADFLYDGQLNKKSLDAVADNFAAKQTSLVVASYAIARDRMEAEEFEALEETGFNWLYQDENLVKYRDLRLRLQRLWAMPFKALVADTEE